MAKQMKRAVFAFGMIMLSAGMAQAGVLTTLNFGADHVDSGRGLPPPDPGVYCPGSDDIPCFKDKIETFTGHGIIEHVSLTATLSWSFSELSLDLKHDGVTVGLVFARHSLLDRAVTVTFDDLAATPLPGFPVVSGTFRPDSPLSAFNGLDASGDWTLTIGDHDSGDTSSYSGAVLAVTTPEPATLVLLILGLAGLGFSRRRKH